MGISSVTTAACGVAASKSLLQGRVANYVCSRIVFLTLLAHIVALSVGIEWLALSSTEQKATWNLTTDCARRKSTGLLKDQRSICQRNLELMPFVVSASRQTVDVCQDLFADRRWNCSSVQRAPHYLPDLIGGSREQAYVFALSAASLAQSVAKGCSAGLSSKCNCGPTPNEPPPGGFKWGGCGDDVRFGVIFSKWFTDTQFNRRKMSRGALMNMHNNGVGRKILADSTSTACKCHGVSGSCSIKTCFKSLPSMRIIGAVLQRRYTVAIEVNKLNSNRLDRIRSARRPKSVSTPYKRVSDDDLIYYTISPDYCLRDESLGSLGTQGRECNKTHSGSSGCRSMCCGRGYTTETIEQSHRCDCRYYWCCYVKCRTCTKTVHVHRCR